jgi:NFU1 iron-sulfur cluster scaffold homolog, mitochondrial
MTEQVDYVMTHEIKITAHVNPAQPDTCTFDVEQMVYPYGTITFSSRAEAVGSPLAERLFAVPGVSQCLLAGQHVTVDTDGPQDWRIVGKLVGQAIREHLQSGQDAVATARQPARLSDEALKQQLQALFETQVNPAIASHGGQVALTDVKAGKVYVRMSGGCQGCASASATLRQGIETMVRQHIPQVTELIDVTDHAAGDNPYYAS